MGAGRWETGGGDYWEGGREAVPPSPQPARRLLPVSPSPCRAAAAGRAGRPRLGVGGGRQGEGPIGREGGRRSHLRLSQLVVCRPYHRVLVELQLLGEQVDPVWEWEVGGGRWGTGGGDYWEGGREGGGPTFASASSSSAARITESLSSCSCWASRSTPSGSGRWEVGDRGRGLLGGREAVPPSPQPARRQSLVSPSPCRAVAAGRAGRPRLGVGGGRWERWETGGGAYWEGGRWSHLGLSQLVICCPYHRVLVELQLLGEQVDPVWEWEVGGGGQGEGPIGEGGREAVPPSPQPARRLLPVSPSPCRAAAAGRAGRPRPAPSPAPRCVRPRTASASTRRARDPPRRSPRAAARRSAAAGSRSAGGGQGVPPVT